MFPLQILSQAQLLRVAHNALESARAHDPGAVEAGSLRLFDAFTERVLAEREMIAQLSSGEVHQLRQSQERAADLLLALAASATQRADRCRCEQLAEDLIVELAEAASL